MMAYVVRAVIGYVSRGTRAIRGLEGAGEELKACQEQVGRRED
jgi:hypothetical protein